MQNPGLIFLLFIVLIGSAHQRVYAQKRKSNVVIKSEGKFTKEKVNEAPGQINKQTVGEESYLKTGDVFVLKNVGAVGTAGYLYFVTPEGTLGKYSSAGQVEYISTPKLRAAGPINSFEQLVQTFDLENLDLISDTVSINIKVPNLEMDEERFFVLQYDLDGDPVPVNKKLSHSGTNLYLITKEIFKVDGDSVDPIKASNFKLYYYEQGQKKRTLVADFDRVNLQQGDMDEEVLLLLRSIEPGIAKDQREAIVAAYLESAYHSILQPDIQNTFARADRIVQKERSK